MENQHSKLEDEKKELIKKINEYNNLFEKNKLKRSIFSLILYTLIIAIISFIKDFDKTINIEQILDVLILSVFLAVISFLINSLLFTYFTDKSQTEKKILESMKKRLAELEVKSGKNKNEML